MFSRVDEDRARGMEQSLETGARTPVPSVSVVVPTYQRRWYVVRAVRSALAQTFEDFELVVVDDGSTDGTGAALAGLDRRIRYVWQENEGVAAACNAGIRLARAPIVAFLHSDDRWRHNHLSIVLQAFQSRPEAVLVCTRPRFLFSGRTPAREPRVLDALPLLLVENFVGHPSSVAVQRAAAVAVGGFDETLVVSEGRELWFRLSTQGPFCLIERRTTIIQVTQTSLTEHGRASGAHVPADELMAERIATEVARLDRPDSAQLAAGAQGRLQYVAALRGLVSRDDEAVARALEEACGLLPALSTEAFLVTRRIQHIANGRPERLRHLVTAATLWPEPRSDTALYLRGSSILLALRMGKPRTAAQLAARWPLTATPGFLTRTYPLWWRLATTTLGSWTHLSRDTVYERRVESGSPHPPVASGL